MTNQIRNVSIFLLATLLLVSSSLARRSAQPAGQSQTDSTAPKSSQTSDSSATAQKKPQSRKSGSAAAVPATAAPASAPLPMSTPARPGSSNTAPAKPAASQSQAQQTPPANPNAVVWVNTESGVYHKPGSRWYGKTKQGKYMTEADAQRAGYRPAGKNQ